MSKQYKKQAEKTVDELTYLIEEEIQLLPFLLKVLSHRSRNSVKSILSRGQVKVNDVIITQFNHLLQPGQTIGIVTNKAAIKKDTLIGLTIEYEDKDIIVVHKDAGLLSIASEREKQLTVHHQLMMYVRTENPINRVFVVHRLDKDTSGLMIFAKNERAKKTLQDNWQRMVKERLYVALVHGKVNKETGKMVSWLRESKTRQMYSSFTKNDGLYAETHYKVMQSNKDYSLLAVTLQTGRKNQIRVHMKDIGHPVVGDKKYGKSINVIHRLGLHAMALSFIHPGTKKLMRFETKIPRTFLVKSK